MGAYMEGMEEVLRTFRQLEGAAQADTLADGAEFAAEPMRRAASNRAPRRSGELSRGIMKEIAEKRMGRASVDVGPHADEFYGRFIEKGWLNVPPRPFLRPAFDKEKETVVRWFAEFMSHWFDSIR